MNNRLEIAPMVVPSTPTDVVVGDYWLFELHIVNTAAAGGASSVVWVYDKQTPAIALIAGMSVNAGGGTLSVNSSLGRMMPGGITWSATGPAVVHGWMVGMSR